jgi:hypothetical protein
MRIPDALTKSVGFVSRDTDPLQFGGTAFLVQVPYDESSGCLHLVTAKHVADAVGPNCVFALNGRDGKTLFAKAPEPRWFFHPTEADSVDAAVLPFSTTRTKDYNISPIPVEVFATEQRIEEQAIGLGDEVFSIGLFTKYFGRSSMIPIVRTGNIAMMPQEKVPLGGFGLAEAYLIEGRSIGGLSGSPVFCRNTLNISGQNERGEVHRLSGLGQLHLLGLVHGHWDLPISFTEFDKVEALNMGISIVIPAKKILEILHSEALAEAREEAFKRSRD